MSSFPRLELVLSACAAGVLCILAIGWAFGTLSHENWSAWLFALATMTVSGSVAFFNLWMLASNRASSAIRFAHPNDDGAPERLFSASSTTLAMATYWAIGMAAALYYRLG